MYSDAKTAISRISRQHDVIVATNLPNDFAQPILRKLDIKFDFVYSAVSDFFLPGKTPEFYRRVVKDLGVDGKTVLHIGDDPVLDYRNPSRAGLNALIIVRDRTRPKYPHIRSLRFLETMRSRR